MKCDICGKDLLLVRIDGKTAFGPWANMCPSCHRDQGIGFGTGKGQMFDILTGKKLAGDEVNAWKR